MYKPYFKESKIKQIVKKEMINGVALTILMEDISQDLVVNDVERVKNDLIEAMSLIEKAKLKKAMTGLTVNIDFRIKTAKHDVLRVGGLYDLKSDSINIYFNPFENNPKDYTYNIIHEIGHRLEWKVLKSQEEWKEFYDTVVEKKDFPTEYSKKNSHEFFAEVFAYYATKKKLSKIVENKFKEITGLK
jgi:hypothetical protein